MAFRLSGDVGKALGNKYKLVPLLEKAVDEGDFNWNFEYSPKVDDGAWHPSSDCTPSIYELYQKMTGEAEPWVISGSLRKTFMVGHFWHAYIQWIVTEKLKLCDWEDIERKGSQSWGDKPYEKVNGSGDIAPVHLPEGDYLVDIKTMGGHDFKHSGLPQRFADKWECQVNIYMDFFDLENTIILGVQKDSPHAFREYNFVRNQPLIDAIHLKWRLVSQCLREGIVPPEDEHIELPLRGQS